MLQLKITRIETNQRKSNDLYLIEIFTIYEACDILCKYKV